VNEANKSQKGSIDSPKIVGPAKLEKSGDGQYNVSSCGKTILSKGAFLK
jgi:hypothetical protein